MIESVAAEIRSAPSIESAGAAAAKIPPSAPFPPLLGWSHYLVLLEQAIIDRQPARGQNEGFTPVARPAYPSSPTARSSIHTAAAGSQKRGSLAGHTRCTPARPAVTRRPAARSSSAAGLGSPRRRGS